jgi:CHAD domain-containing protein
MGSNDDEHVDGSWAVASLPVVPSLPKDPSAGDVLSVAVARSVRRIVRNLPGVRAGVDPEALHAARVAIRRLRSNLKVFDPVFDPDWSASMRKQLAGLGAVLGDVRDLDVLLGTLVELAVAEPTVAMADADLLIGHFVRVRAEHRQDLIAALDGEETRLLIARLIESIEELPTSSRAEQPAVEVLPALTRRPWRRLKRAMAAVRTDTPITDLHRIRILAKRCRYTADAVRPVTNTHSEDFAAAMSQIQECLGDVHDAFAISGRLRDAARAQPELGFGAGQMSGILAGRAHDNRGELAAIWSEASRKALRQWW